MSVGKGIQLSTGFDVNTAQPLDSRELVNSIEERDALINVYNGLRCYVNGVGAFIYIDGVWSESDSKVSEDDETIQNIINEVTELSSDVDELDIKIDNTNKNIDTLNSTVDELDIKIDNTNRNVDTLNSTVIELNNSFDELSSNVGSFSNEIDELDTKIDNTNNNVSVLNSTVIELNNNFGELSSNVGSFSNEIDELGVKIDNVIEYSNIVPQEEETLLWVDTSTDGDASSPLLSNEIILEFQGIIGELRTQIDKLKKDNIALERRIAYLEQHGSGSGGGGDIPDYEGEELIMVFEDGTQMTFEDGSIMTFEE